MYPGSGFPPSQGWKGGKGRGRGKGWKGGYQQPAPYNPYYPANPPKGGKGYNPEQYHYPYQPSHYYNPTDQTDFYPLDWPGPQTERHPTQTPQQQQPQPQPQPPRRAPKTLEQLRQLVAESRRLLQEMEQAQREGVKSCGCGMRTVVNGRECILICVEHAAGASSSARPHTGRGGSYSPYSSQSAESSSPLPSQFTGGKGGKGSTQITGFDTPSEYHDPG